MVKSRFLALAAAAALALSGTCDAPPTLDEPAVKANKNIVNTKSAQGGDLLSVEEIKDLHSPVAKEMAYKEIMAHCQAKQSALARKFEHLAEPDWKGKQIPAWSRDNSLGQSTIELMNYGDEEGLLKLLYSATHEEEKDLLRQTIEACKKYHAAMAGLQPLLLARHVAQPVVH